MTIGIDALSRYLVARRGLDERAGNRADAGLAGSATGRPTSNRRLGHDRVFFRPLGQAAHQANRTVHRADALAMFTRLATESFTVVPVSRLQFRTAARFVEQHALGLRAGDALHLAICADHGATLCTLDRRLSDAASALGLKTMLF